MLLYSQRTCSVKGLASCHQPRSKVMAHSHASHPPLHLHELRANGMPACMHSTPPSNFLVAAHFTYCQLPSPNIPLSLPPGHPSESEEGLVLLAWILPPALMAHHVPVEASPVVHFRPVIVAVEAVAVPILGGKTQILSTGLLPTKKRQTHLFPSCRTSAITHWS
jgi:hypothetical protein